MTIELIDHLIEELNANNIPYCHWKSNYSLAETFSGMMDIDLLVERRSLPQTLGVLTSLGFKQAVVRSAIETLGVSHYYGFDVQSGQLIHVHMFSRILTGESFVKSHVFPFENMLLSQTYRIGQIKVTSRPAELVLFILRTFVKYGSFLDLLYLIGKSENIKAELDWLMSGYDISESLNLLKTNCPVVDEKLFLACIDALKERSSLIENLLLSYRMRKRLHVYAVDGSFRHMLDYLRFLWEQGMRRLNGRRKNKTLHAGGAVIAFVGPEATGKSTLVAETKNWLGQAFTVHSIHAGKPPSSWITLPVNLILPLIRRLLPGFRTSRMEGHVSPSKELQEAPQLKGTSGLIYAIRSVSLAWDRRRLLIKAGRLAADGQFVICDRYPSESVGAMDSPRLKENTQADGILGRLINKLADLENRLYQQIPPPDLVLKLKVSMEIAKIRNRERIKVDKESDAYLESRHRQMRDWSKTGTKYIHEIDTGLPLTETILNVKRSIWESI